MIDWGFVELFCLFFFCLACFFFVFFFFFGLAIFYPQHSD